jgi:predicted Rossmann fold nucleotide-binding protein DprA/Smf involved in DNA uptake
MSRFSIQESDQFLTDVEESAVWILESNLEHSEDLALRKVDEFQSEIEALKERLKDFPDSGEQDVIKGVRKFPIYHGRYSLKWVVQKTDKLITLIALSDSKYPKALRNIQLDDL